MIPQDIRLFTWVDVEEVLLRVQGTSEWPNWLHGAQAYLDGLILEVLPGYKEEAFDWLTDDIFAPRFERTRDDKGNTIEAFILLLSAEQQQRQFEIRIDETDEMPSNVPFRPRLSRPSTINSSKPIAAPPPFPEDIPPLIAMHSFKGGVGRTLHTIALAKAIVNRSPDKPVLLIDADLEAPGITWLLDDHKLPDSISFVDILALVHSASTAELEQGATIEFIVGWIKKYNPLIDGIYVIPAFRSKKVFTSLQIKPEHLIQGSNPFIITDTLAQIGRILNNSAVLIDLRAGLSELASGFLLDPRLFRILVTTISAQSMNGTKNILQLLQELTPPNVAYLPPNVIFSQIPIDIFGKKEKMNPYQEDLEGVARVFWQKGKSSELQPKNPILQTPFDQNLMVLSGSWKECSEQIQYSRVYREVQSWIDDFPSFRVKEKLSIPMAEKFPHTLQEKRRQLAEKAKALLTVASSQAIGFLPSKTIHNLANDFQRKVPVVLITGPTGSGKTSLFLQIIQRQWWETFVTDAGLQGLTQKQIGCYPVWYAPNFSYQIQTMISATEDVMKKYLGVSESFLPIDMFRAIEEGILKSFNRDEWRDLWLNVFAWRVGFRVRKPDAGQQLPDYLRDAHKQLILVIDALEDLFPDSLGDKNAQIALQVLIQDILPWLEQQPERPLGIVLLARKQILKAAIPQDGETIFDLYAPYELSWSTEDVLRLLVWIFREILPSQIPNLSEVLHAPEEHLLQWLTPLWGETIGGENVSSPDRFIIDVVSNVAGEFQVKDIIWFMYKAAQNSMKETTWTETLLTPNAIYQTEREYFMQFTRKQEVKLRIFSDEVLFQDARAFIAEQGTLRNHQISGLANIAECVTNVADIISFTKHQANKAGGMSDFYGALTKKLEAIVQQFKTNSEFIPKDISKKQLQEYTEMYGLFVAREFIHHLAAENLYQAKEGEKR